MAYGFKSGGRQKGTPNKSTQEVRELLDLNKIEIVEKAIEEALNGNNTILSKLLDKLLPTLAETTNHNIDDFIIAMEDDIILN